MCKITEKYPIHEISSALLSSSIISPFMLTIDMSIIRSHLKTEKGITSFLNVLNDLRSRSLPFWRPYRIMNQVYFSTFGTANVMEYYSKRYSIESQIPTILMTSTVNIGMMSYKDREYSHYFGIKRPIMPWTSKVLTASGAFITVYAQFTKKQEVDKYLSTYLSPSASLFWSSILVSMSAQLFSTPLHIIGIDIYQSPHNTFLERLEKIKSLYTTICIGRMMRIIPAFGVGGYLNEKWKRSQSFNSSNSNSNNK
jgi:hypothetical protein